MTIAREKLSPGFGIAPRRVDLSRGRVRRDKINAVAGSSFGIEGMKQDEAAALPGELKAHALQEKYRYSHRYDVGDVVLWVNLATLHSATLTDPAMPRTLWRITVKEPIGAWA